MEIRPEIQKFAEYMEAIMKDMMVEGDYVKWN